MTTEAARSLEMLAEGEPATEQVEALDALWLRHHRGELGDDEFLNEIYLIEAIVQQRLGRPQRRGYVPVPEEEELPDAEPPREQRLGYFWHLTRKMALNAKVELISNEEVWAEFEDEIREYEEAHGLGPLVG